MTTNKVKALGKLGTHDVEAVAINPGGWFGKVWLIELGGSYWPTFLAIEADSASDAIDELADDDTFGPQIRVEDSDLGDYSEDERSYAGNCSHVVDLDHVMIHGCEYPRHSDKSPWECVYFDERLPSPVKPCVYSDAVNAWEEEQSEAV